MKRFWSKVSKGKVNECWPWTASVHSKYGQLKWEGRKNIDAHRAAWILTNGKIPAGQFVLHTCDNTLCCNPRHLWLGTQADNMGDMKGKGRARRGEKHGHAKLTAKVVSAIRADTRLQREIAADLGVTQSLISMVKSGVIWGHVP